MTNWAEKGISWLGLAFLAMMSAFLLGSCSSDNADEAVHPGQRIQTQGVKTDATRLDGEAVTYRPGTSLLLGTPIFDGDFADPYVLVVDDDFYAYSTNTTDALVPVFVVERSLIARYLGDALAALPAWSEPGFVWAPAVLALDDGYVLYYTTRLAGTETQCISRAVSDSPSGPFTDDSTAPMVCQEDLGGSIDPSIVTDPDGAPWLLFKNDGNCCGIATSIWSQQLAADGLSVIGSATELLGAESGWEGDLVEGPSMLIAPDDYLLFYSANAWDTANYAIGWARCESITGPCVNQSDDKPWMGSTTFARGPGGEEFFTALGDVWMVYHGWERGDVGKPDAERRLYADIVEVGDDGKPRRVGSRNALILFGGVGLVILAAIGGVWWWLRRRRSNRDTDDTDDTESG